ncbi:hypothetical protein I601_2268 [Nocardioides dokdonensis FR1436]|uniref:Uncharacterized protein n=1 Tax=Nocardioides dokdonensis FR1436 TaxID=1300347 RepID=A0A1A9GLZ9_9ACTN|nr:hypothetical protein [Nocardioides dokdonensis]ANH38692.1 hypothetical protein I601_2268 [Nocardioides dokdonensis FR1436]
MHQVVGEGVIPFLRKLGGDGSTSSSHMKDARYTIPAPALLSKVVDLVDDIPLNDRDTTGVLYEYMVDKNAIEGPPTREDHADEAGHPLLRPEPTGVTTESPGVAAEHAAPVDGAFRQSIHSASPVISVVCGIALGGRGWWVATGLVGHLTHGTPYVSDASTSGAA